MTPVTSLQPAYLDATNGPSPLHLPFFRARREQSLNFGGLSLQPETCAKFSCKFPRGRRSLFGSQICGAISPCTGRNPPSCVRQSASPPSFSPSPLSQTLSSPPPDPPSSRRQRTLKPPPPRSFPSPGSRSTKMASASSSTPGASPATSPSPSTSPPRSSTMCFSRSPPSTSTAAASPARATTPPPRWSSS